LPGLPPAEYYNPDGMLKKTQEKFYKWHNANKNIPFYLPDQLASYCFSGKNIFKISFTYLIFKNLKFI
jgi:hypothetical protein